MMLMHAHNIIMLGLAHFLRRLCLEKLKYNNKNKRNTRLGKPDGFKAPSRRVQSDGRNCCWHARRQHTLQIVGVLKETVNTVSLNVVLSDFCSPSQVKLTLPPTAITAGYKLSPCPSPPIRMCVLVS